MHEKHYFFYNIYIENETSKLNTILLCITQYIIENYNTLCLYSIIHLLTTHRQYILQVKNLYFE